MEVAQALATFAEKTITMEQQIKKDREQELIEGFAFKAGKKSSISEVIESYRDTAEERDCFCF